MAVSKTNPRQEQDDHLMVDGAPEDTPMPGWVGMAEVRSMSRDDERRTQEWRQTFLNEWCGAAVEVEGHLLPCGMDKGHPGGCRVAEDLEKVRRVLAQHRAHPGQCRRHGCAV